MRRCQINPDDFMSLRQRTLDSKLVSAFASLVLAFALTQTAKADPIAAPDEPKVVPNRVAPKVEPPESLAITGKVAPAGEGF